MLSKLGSKAKSRRPCRGARQKSCDGGGGDTALGYHKSENVVLGNYWERSLSPRPAEMTDQNQRGLTRTEAAFAGESSDGAHARQRRWRFGRSLPSMYHPIQCGTKRRGSVLHGAFPPKGRPTLTHMHTTHLLVVQVKEPASRHLRRVVIFLYRGANVDHRIPVFLHTKSQAKRRRLFSIWCSQKKHNDVVASSLAGGGGRQAGPGTAHCTMYRGTILGKADDMCRAFPK